LGVVNYSTNFLISPNRSLNHQFQGKTKKMPDCKDFEVGQVWTCDCGLELKVVNTCTSCSDEGGCGCSDEGHDHDHVSCSFNCCGKPLTLKK